MHNSPLPHFHPSRDPSTLSQIELTHPPPFLVQDQTHFPVTLPPSATTRVRYYLPLSQVPLSISFLFQFPLPLIPSFALPAFLHLLSPLPIFLHFLSLGSNTLSHSPHFLYHSPPLPTISPSPHHPPSSSTILPPLPTSPPLPLVPGPPTPKGTAAGAHYAEGRKRPPRTSAGEQGTRRAPGAVALAPSLSLRLTFF